MKGRIILSAVLLQSVLSIGSLPAWAEDEKPQPDSAPTAPLTLPSMPSMVGPLTANPNPMTIDAGPLGQVFVTGVVSGLGYYQDNALPGDLDSRADISNAQIFLQTTEGPLQFYLQAGAYSLPALGATYFKASDATDDFYGPLPTAFLKFAPSDNFSVIAGKLPTMMGSEYTFTIENPNIQRGLLWNQENAITRGVQANYTHGPLTLAASVNDGFYSESYNWLWGSASYAINSENSVTLIGGGNLGETKRSTLATPFFQNNGSMYDIIYTYNSAPWTIIPSLQYTDVPKNTDIGIADGASTLGASVIAKYAIDSNWSMAARAEYIDSDGSVDEGSPSLLYGPGSNAWSITVTPTYQYKTFFARLEGSFVKAGDTTDGFAFGKDLNEDTQTRAMFEVGVIF